ncbi:hypothetical protein AQ910_05755 [Burkholderia pseudomallei]|uniref:DUF72 domain-containing protein n=1 Tax=Burkholderia pseudomallei TaxID=28450 RepID=UPI000536FF6E|nr:DUF72 domain-containing protein [Burkholderia pseudomallei]AJX23142.1 hypothetical protein BG17_1369 [Burkholderia pseudomallei MSHR491]KGW82937.1 hypothetical protein Y034_783 [Burkholderia pseudomallei MSHR449]KGX74211.1 hypothetical protein Y033_648 [Burkholderia pseudomallei MSHR435]ONC06108.1 hypothetical protein AQ910_05755 [Burkholderia pseudomallei]
MAIKIGTANWTDKTLIACKRFYPAGCSSAEARLRYYASQFPLVEVDSSYYAMPSVQNALLWAERTPAEFVFSVKAFRLLTGHQTGREALTKDIAMAIPETGKKNLYYRDVPPDVRDELWRRFLEALGPLWQAGKLGAVLFQFPPWLTSGPEGRAQLDECVRRMEGYTTAVEFRNKSWFDERHVASTLAFEREHGVVHVVIDAPVGVTNRGQTVWAVTNPELAVVRLHGRNAQTWNAVGATSAAARFNYDYSDDELHELAAPIRELAAQVTDTHVVFNNCYEDYATRNARSLMRMIDG